MIKKNNYNIFSDKTDNRKRRNLKKNSIKSKNTRHNFNPNKHKDQMKQKFTKTFGQSIAKKIFRGS
jgi:hypothetical protein